MVGGAYKHLWVCRTVGKEMKMGSGVFSVTEVMAIKSTVVPERAPSVALRARGGLCESLTVLYVVAAAWVWV